ncbi:hypothetical protein ECP02989426_4840 [Escherichia coli P0298942.6]|nr:hypothetical protein EC2871950_5030 [Escherichia coli 2871950]EMW26482.1 hypothetical protein EC2845350_4901 [Escherichia coli 2845350]EMZ59746.1 hypothetical protein EC2846750_4889 [Escherichia coli 2846750]ENA07469.1 hypothetical protein ECP02989421_5135 [Escherichia coli P0298942.1]ENB43054.1 hypothetical protein ECP029894211_4884 [Escherichia coli P0298942.11]ENB52409.1 hypothetical protein ECP029894212_4878 [Escherichia coli P0298942.12]ENB55882.1 hypothetical protein ECP02989426_4840
MPETSNDGNAERGELKRVRRSLHTDLRSNDVLLPEILGKTA